MTFGECLLGVVQLLEGHEGEGSFRRLHEALTEGDGTEQVVMDDHMMAYAAGYLRGAAEYADLTITQLLEEAFINEAFTEPRKG